MTSCISLGLSSLPVPVQMQSNPEGNNVRADIGPEVLIAASAVSISQHQSEAGEQAAGNDSKSPSTAKGEGCSTHLAVVARRGGGGGTGDAGEDLVGGRRGSRTRGLGA